MNSRNETIVIVIAIILLLGVGLGVGLFFKKSSSSAADGNNPLKSIFDTDKCLENTDVNDKCWFSVGIHELNCVAKCKQKDGVKFFPLEESDKSKLLSSCKKGCERNPTYKDDCVAACDFKNCEIRAIEEAGKEDFKNMDKYFSDLEECKTGSSRQSGAYFSCLMDEIDGTSPRMGLQNCGWQASKKVEYEEAQRDCRKLAEKLGKECPPETCCRGLEDIK